MKQPFNVQWSLVIAVLFISMISAATVLADKPGSCKKPDGSLACGSSAGGCYCDKACVKYGDCCSDAITLCQNTCPNCPPSAPIPPCGNNIVDEGEECDGTHFKVGTLSCPYTGGWIECTNDCKISKEFCTGPIKTYECYDSDNGKKEYVAGYTKGYDESGNPVEKKDYCTPDGLVEYYCEFPSGKVVSQLLGPPTHCAVCSDGACKKPEEPPAPILPCTDSDGGINIFTAGTVLDSENKKESDYCKSGVPGYIVEYYCGSTGKAEAKTFGPAEGCYTCADGACLSLPKPPSITKKDVINWITNNC